MKALIIIPARLASSRLSEKLLLGATGKPLIQHTYEAASRSRLANSVLVAADDQRIVDVVKQFGGNAVMTARHHPSGTDRLAEVAKRHSEIDIFVNVQGDEPEIDARDIDSVIEALQQDPAEMATLATPIRDLDALMDPACVKVIFDANHRAIYFSRHAIPYARDGFEQWISHDPPVFYQHVGLYAYRRDFLIRFPDLQRPDCEEAEMLEQLRALHAGARILVQLTPHAARGIDTADDYDAFVTRQTT